MERLSPAFCLTIGPVFHRALGRCRHAPRLQRLHNDSPVRAEQTSEGVREVCADFNAELVKMDGEDDHVHLLVNYPPKGIGLGLSKQP
jgi:REP element-mobilizing transposase RayT